MKETEETKEVLPPGSEEAIRAGCQCPVLDNGHGRGYLGDGQKFGWWINDDCPMHGTKAKEEGAHGTVL